MISQVQSARCTTHFSGVGAPEVAACAPCLLWTVIIVALTAHCFQSRCFARFCALTWSPRLAQALKAAAQGCMPNLAFLSTCDLLCKETMSSLEAMGLLNDHKHHFENMLHRVPAKHWLLVKLIYPSLCSVDGAIALQCWYSSFLRSSRCPGVPKSHEHMFSPVGAKLHSYEERLKTAKQLVFKSTARRGFGIQQANTVAYGLISTLYSIYSALPCLFVSRCLVQVLQVQKELPSST